MIDFASVLLISAGLFFLLVGSIGMLRFTDVYMRMHASSKVLTFGFSFVILGVAIQFGPTQILQALVAIAFQWMTAPIAAHAMARAALRRGEYPVKVTRTLT